MRFSSFISKPTWNAAFIAELCIGIGLMVGGIAALLSLGMHDVTASYQYDGMDRHETSIPFLVDQEGEYLSVNIQFTLNTLHANRFVIGPDDCIEEVIVNGESVHGLNGRCNMHPGFVVSLPALQQGENTLSIRLHDTGGQGGLMLRTSWTDPLWLTFLILTLLMFSWVGARLMLLLSRSKEIAWLPAILAVAFAIRLGLSWHGGFGGDISLNQDWSESAVKLGLIQSYNEQVESDAMLPNYPPLSIGMFAITGYAYQTFVSPDFDEEAPIYRVIIKLPAIIADLITVIVLYLLLVPIGGRRQSLIAAALYAVHPAVIHDSAVWGQIDSVFTLFMCLTILSMQRHRWICAGVLMASALLIKMQALLLVPVVVVAAGFDIRRWMRLVLGGTTIALITAIPFTVYGAFDRLLSVYTGSVGFYNTLSYNAYNFWVMLYTRETGKSATDLFLGPLSHRMFGLIAWFTVIVCVTVLWFPAIQQDIKSKGKTGVTLLSAALIAYAFFLFNAEMHERYLFPFMALGIPLLLLGRKGITLYISASVLFTLNLISLVAFSDVDRMILQETFKEAHPVAIATANMITFVCIWVFAHAYQKSTIKGPGGWKALLPRFRHGATRWNLLRWPFLR